jgi:hypothetical protein
LEFEISALKQHVRGNESSCEHDESGDYDQIIKMPEDGDEVRD